MTVTELLEALRRVPGHTPVRLEIVGKVATDLYPVTAVEVVEVQEPLEVHPATAAAPPRTTSGGFVLTIQASAKPRGHR